MTKIDYIKAYLDLIKLFLTAGIGAIYLMLIYIMQNLEYLSANLFTSFLILVGMFAISFMMVYNGRCYFELAEKLNEDHEPDSESQKIERN